MDYQFSHFRLLVTDFKRSFHFYKDILGFDVLWGDEHGSYADFRTGQTKIAIFKRNLMAKAVGQGGKPRAADSQDVVALIFSVKNVDDTFRKLKPKGVTVVNEPKDYRSWGVRAAHFRDPDGYLIEINSDLQR